MAGSVAKGTMSKDPDLDLFILFPANSSKRELEKKGMKIGKMVLNDPKKKYTQHPYLTGSFHGFNCDIVPCISIEKGSKIRTAVDRTPHHTEYINSRLKQQQKDDVLLLKSFLKGIGGYGAEDTVQGFSGYLVELLILNFRSFEGVIEFLSGIDPGVEAPFGCEEIQKTTYDEKKPEMVLIEEGDLADETPLEEREYLEMFRNDPLIVIDPVDRNRNVASPISHQTLAYVSRSSTELMRKISIDLFFPFSRRPLIPNGKGKLQLSDLHYFTTSLPEGDPGIVITQLRRSLRKLTEELRRTGFQGAVVRFLLRFSPKFDIDQSYLRARYTWEGEVSQPTILISVRTDPGILDREFVHWGPPVDNKRIEDFKEKYGEKVRIDDSIDKAYVELEREMIEPIEISLDIWNSIHHGSRFLDSILEIVDSTKLEQNLLKALEGS
jgi:tRNA CCA-adding enzyme